MKEVKVFSKYKGPIFEPDNLIKIQKDSFKWLLEDGFKEVLKEYSPITDYSGKEIELHFLDYKIEPPKYSEDQARERDTTFEAPVRLKVKLVNNVTKEIKEQEIYFGEFPIMTERGTFIINGVERVIVSQLIRSPGVYFTLFESVKGRKLFGAKVIPNKGSWLEFETDSDGFIGVKIDKKRKTAATHLLKIFGLKTNEEIKKIFSDVDNGKIKFIEATLKKDPHSIEEAYIEVYKRLRPGDLPNLQSAKLLVDNIFKRTDRYDLGKVGRYKFNQRLNIIHKPLEQGLLDLQDLISLLKEIIRLNNDPFAEADDIDNLLNRRIRAVGELIQNRLKVGFARLKRVVQDRISTLERKNLQPTQLINYKVVTSVVKDFFATAQLSQFMDQINPLSELENKRRLSVMGQGGLNKERASFEVRDVQPSYYGRICPIQTPEGQTSGLVNNLANNVRMNSLGFLEAPYFKVKNGRITNEIIWLDAYNENKYNIIPADTLLNDKNEIIPKILEGRIKGEPGMCHRNEVDLMDVSVNHVFSLATSLIPFLEHDDATRALMGSNMQRQAVPLIKTEAPLVGTGQEEKAANDSGWLVRSEVEGEVIEVDPKKVVIKSKEGKKVIYPVIKFKRSNKATCFSQRPVVNKGQKVKKGDLIIDGPAMDQGVLALGQNLLVAFLPFEGTNFEDAIILSEKVVRDDRYTSIHIETFTCLVRETKLGPELTTPDIPNVSDEKLKNLDEEGIVRIGAEVGPNDILVGKISPKGESELSSEEKLLRAIFGEKARDIKDTSLVLPNGKQGRVIGIKIFSRDKGDKLEPGIIKKIQIEVAQIRRIRAGDKLTGRHGNKGVISQVRPIEDMPFLEDGTPVDVVLNPLGVASRMNLGQIFETHLGLAAHHLNYRAVVPNFVGLNQEEIEKELIKAGFSKTGKVKLFNGMTGEPFRDEVTVGYIYLMKLNHLVEDKIHMRSTGPYSLITQQPLGGKAQMGGQRFGEMEVWSLEGYGAAHTLQEMLTIKSDDVLGRASVFEAIIKGQEIKKPNIPASFNVLVAELKALGLNVKINEGIEEKESKFIKKVEKKKNK